MSLIESNSNELNSLITHENNFRVLKKFYFVKFGYLGDSVEEAATKLRVTKKTGYYWQEDWNKGGYTALMPQFCGGRKSKLTNEQIEDIIKEFTEREGLMDYQRSFGINNGKI